MSYSLPKKNQGMISFYGYPGVKSWVYIKSQRIFQSLKFHKIL